ncbi:MAG: hypothetical protein K8R79_09190, partial [Calditrichales bacterium]|nr:hypothetical protein [Calditrichales bacterium]
MSLTYKLWKIGNILTEEEIEEVIKSSPDIKDVQEINYVNINFKVVNNEIYGFFISDESIEKNKLFFTKKIGGTSNAYYLYPNLNLKLSEKDKLEDKFKIIKNTLLNSVLKFSEQEHTFLIEEAIGYCQKQEKEIKQELAKYKKKEGIYWLWLSINGKTFFELMPEVWDNWYKNPVLRNENAGMGYDALTNTEGEIGYKPDIKVFSYDNYHKSLKYRIDDNLPLSLESAKKIKFAWMYILENLVFYYKGLEYIILPNLLSDNDKILKNIINRLRRANNKTNLKSSSLEKLKAQENKFIKELEKIKNKKQDVEKLNIEKELEETDDEIKKRELGIIQEFNEQIQELDELKNSITLDYIFTSIDRKNLSFTIKGTIEDVIPSQLSNVVKDMREFNISDLVTLKKRDKDKIYL